MMGSTGGLKTLPSSNAITDALSLLMAFGSGELSKAKIDILQTMLERQQEYESIVKLAKEQKAEAIAAQAEASSKLASAMDALSKVGIEQASLEAAKSESRRFQLALDMRSTSLDKDREQLNQAQADLAIKVASVDAYLKTQQDALEKREKSAQNILTQAQDTQAEYEGKLRVLKSLT